MESELIKRAKAELNDENERKAVDMVKTHLRGIANQQTIIKNAKEEIARLQAAMHAVSFEPTE